jgi:hypothetical protein
MRRRRTAINSSGQKTGLQWHGKAMLGLRLVGAEKATAKREVRMSVNFMIVCFGVYLMDLNIWNDRRGRRYPDLVL